MASGFASPLLWLLLAMAAVGAVVAGDPESINDFCVADLTSPLVFNGLACKKVADVVDADFKFKIVPGNTSNSGRLGIAITPAFAAQFPALNTLGISTVRIDFAKGGLVPPHHHPRATEIFYVVKGKVMCGVISTANKLYQQVVNAGEVFVFPRGLVHFQKNLGSGKAFGISSLNSQNPGVLLEANALLATTPLIPADILSQTINVPPADIVAVQKQFVS